MKLMRLLPWIVIATALPGVSWADGDVFAWRDAQGNMVFSQEGSSIPFDRDVVVLTFPKPAEPTQAAPAAEAPSRDPATEVVVPIRSAWALPTVQAEVNGVAGIDFVVDTGATVTMLNRSLVESLGIDPDAATVTRLVDTAQGTLRAPQIHLDSVKVGDAVIEDLVAVVVDSDDVPNLLGRNFLNNFQVTLDPREQVLILRDATGD